MSKCEHKNRVVEFRDQFPEPGEEWNPKANGVWRVCKDCGHEEQDNFLTQVEDWGRKFFQSDND